MTSSLGTSVLLWTARVWGVASLAFISIFVFGTHVFTQEPRPTRMETVLLALFPFGVAAGILIAFKKERLGGWVAVLCLVALYAVQILTGGGFPKGPLFALVTVPAALFLAHDLWTRQKGDPRRAGVSSERNVS